MWLSSGKTGLLGLDVAEQHGGAGFRGFRYSCVLTEEISRVGGGGSACP